MARCTRLDRTLRRPAGRLAPHSARRVWLLAALLAVASPAWSQPVQLFGSVDRLVAAIGEPFALDVELLASPSSAAETRTIRDRFARGTLGPLAPGVEVVRRSEIEAERHTTGETRGVVVLRRRFVFRALSPGTVRVPAFHLPDGPATARPSVSVYAATGGLFDAAHSVVSVVAEHERHGRRLTRTGSAFAVAPDAVVTSYHVVMEAEQVRLHLPDGKVVTTRQVWALDPARDVAVLYVNPRALARARVAPLPLAPVGSAVLRVDARAPGASFTYGWPGGTQRSTAGAFFARTSLHPFYPVWVSSNPVRPGDSGGPLLDRAGRAIGVVAAGSVLDPRPDVLRQEVCIATDFRPALARRRLADHPRSLRAALHDLSDEPHARTLRLSARLYVRRHDGPTRADLLDEIGAIAAEAPADAGLHFMHGALYHLFGDHARAEQAYRDALDVYDGHFPATYMLARLYLRQERYEEAMRHFARARQAPPYRHLATFGLARAALRLGQYHRAGALLREVLAYDPTFAPARYELAYAHLGRGDLDRARQLLVGLEAQAPSYAGSLRQMLRHAALRPSIGALPARPDLPGHPLHVR